MSDTPTYFDTIRDRSTLRQLISFMLEGEESQKPEFPLSDGLEECDQALTKLLDTCNNSERSDIVSAVADYLIACEHAYMQQGMQTGFRLAVELLTSNDMQPLPATTWKAKASPHKDANAE